MSLKYLKFYLKELFEMVCNFYKKNIIKRLAVFALNITRFVIFVKKLYIE